jgi:hypothetical protein
VTKKSKIKSRGVGWQGSGMEKAKDSGEEVKRSTDDCMKKDARKNKMR